MYRQTVSPSPLARVVLAVLAAVPTLAGTAVAIAQGGSTVAVLGLAAIGLAVLVAIGFALFPNRIEIDAAGELRLRAGIARHRVALAELDADGLQRVDLDRQREFRPRWRTFGTSIPGGFNAGWFRLRNGRKAFVLANRRDRLTLLTPADGPLVLMALDDPERLRRAIGAARGR